MNKKTSNVLSRIARNVPKHLQENITKVVIDTSEEDLARSAMKAPGISQAKKNKIGKMLDQGAFRRSEEVENDETLAKIDEYNDKAVKKAIRDGEIPPPTEDAFIQKRNQKGKVSLALIGSYIQPLGDKVLIVPDEVEKEAKSTFGIILPDNMKKKSFMGTVKAIGSKVMSVRVGWHIVFQDYNYEIVDLKGHTMYIMSEENIIAHIV